MDICSEPEKQFAYRYLRTSHAEAMAGVHQVRMGVLGEHRYDDPAGSALARCGFPHEYACHYRRQELALARARGSAQPDGFVHAR